MAEPTPLTQEQILGQLMTRGFEEGFSRTPLRDFWGTLKSITGEMRDGQTGSFAVALYNSEEVEAIESIEPYTSPIAQIDIPVSTRAKSRMGYFGTSFDKIINAGLPPDVPQAQAKNQDYLIGKRLHWKFTPGHMIWDGNAREERPNNCWEIIGIVGEGGAQAPIPSTAGTEVGADISISQQALNLLDSKNVQQWHQVVLTDPVVKQDTAFINSIIDNSFLAGMEASGKVTKDENGVYHIVP